MKKSIPWWISPFICVRNKGKKKLFFDLFQSSQFNSFPKGCLLCLPFCPPKPAVMACANTCLSHAPLCWEVVISYNYETSNVRINIRLCLPICKEISWHIWKTNYWRGEVKKDDLIVLICFYCLFQQLMNLPCVILFC